MHDELLQQLRCPLTHSPLAPAEPELVQSINAQIGKGTVTNREGEPISIPIDGGFVNASGEWFYPSRNRIPSLLVDEAVDLSSLELASTSSDESSGA